jgi:cellulose synthase (UDP-forming)
MRKIKNRKIKFLLFLATIAATLIYSMTRIVLTIIYAEKYETIEILLSSALLLSELFMLLHAIGYGRHLLRSIDIQEIEADFQPLSFPPPSVAILVAARHEPREILEKTFRSISNIRYPNKNIYFLNDSSDEKYKEEAEEICKKFNIKLFRRDERHGAKAGIINDCLHKVLTEKYVAIFDADQNPIPSFLNPLIPMLEARPELAFVQTPQFYYNSRSNPVAYGATYQQSVFYEYICESKGISQSMFCCGTNVVFRRQALLDVNGFDEAYVTEDIATSLRLHKKGWKSEYYSHVASFGMAPESLLEYFKQQARWSKGNIGVLRNLIISFIKNPKAMSFTQWSEYFLSCTYYFIGLVFLVLVLCPVVYIFFNLPTYFIRHEIYLTVFIPYFSLSLGIFYMTLKARKYKISDVLLGQVLTYITFPIHIKSIILGLLGVQGKFGITLKEKSKAMSYLHLWPQILFIYINFIAFVWGINRLIYEKSFSLVINSFWVLFHFCIMLFVFYFNSGSLLDNKDDKKND